MSNSSNDSSSDHSLTDLQILILSAMFHDIGKAFHRVFSKFEKEFTPKEDKKEEHELLGMRFIEKYLSSINEEDKRRISILVGKHHKQENIQIQESDKFLLDILALADSLSAEMREISDNENNHKNQKMFYNIVIKRFMNQDSKYQNMYWFPFSVLLNHRFFDIQTYKEDILKEHDEKFYYNLRKALETFDHRIFDFHLQNLKYYFKEYLFFMSSYSQGDKQTESLYTHTIAATAIASTLYCSTFRENYKKFYSTRNENTRSNAKKDLHLALIKVSGIQKFIFQFADKDYSGKYASKFTRGRSILISLIIELCARKLVKDLELPLVNIISIVSDKAFLIIPKDRVDKFKQIVSEIDSFMLYNMFPLRLSAAAISLEDIESCTQKESSRLGILFNQANFDLITRKYVGQILTDENKIYCKVCGNVNRKADNKISKFILNSQIIEPEEKELLEKELCNSCAIAYYIGTFSAKNDFVISITDIKDGRKFIDFFDFSFSISIAKDLEKAKLDENGVHIYFSSINNLTKIYTNYYNYVGKFELKVLPRLDIVSNSFDDISELTIEDSKGQISKTSTYIAALKSDYDSLGEFISEVSNNVSKIIEVNETLAGLGLSFVYLAFTEGNNDKNNENEIQKFKLNKSKFYYLFAGGDDLFIFGRFDQILKFYHNYLIETKFLPKLKFSSSIVLFKSGFPVREVAKISSSKVSLAKSKRKEKNSIYLSYIGFNDEKEKVIYNETFIDFLNNALELVSYIDDDLISYSLLYYIYKNIMRTKNDVTNSKLIKEISNTLINYRLVRHQIFEARKNSQELNKKIKDLRNIILNEAIKQPHIIATALLLYSEGILKEVCKYEQF